GEATTQGGLIWPVWALECGSALLCRSCLACFSCFSLETTQKRETKAAEQSTAALQTSRHRPSLACAWPQGHRPFGPTDQAPSPPPLGQVTLTAPAPPAAGPPRRSRAPPVTAGMAPAPAR